MRSAVVAAILAILVVATFGAGYLAGGARTSTVTSVSTATTTLSTGTATVTSTVSLGPPYPASSLETANITIGNQSGAIGVDVNRERIYVSDVSSDNLTVIDGNSHSVVATIPLPASAQVVAADFETHMVYVDAGGVVVEINGTTDQISGELRVEMGTFSYDPVNQVIYGPVNDSLVGLNVRTGAVVANVPLGMYADSVAVDPNTNMVVAAGCNLEGLVCNDTAFIVNGTSNSLVATIPLGGGLYPLVAAGRHLFYVSDPSLTALNETNGKVLFNVDPQECSAFDSMVFVPNTDQLAAISFNHNYVFVYSGLTGALLDMYSLPATPQYVAYNTLTNELYVTISSQLVAFHDSAGPGYVDIALVDSGGNCPLP
jgi:YVTN family beta-propeller protein